MNKRLLIAIAFLPIWFSNSSCAVGRPVPSLCKFEFPVDRPIKPDEKVCWINKAEDNGFTLLDLLDGRFYGLDENDFQKILDKLNECQAGKNCPRR